MNSKRPSLTVNTHHSTATVRSTGKHLKKFAFPHPKLLAVCLALSRPLAPSFCQAQESGNPLPQPGASLTTDHTDYPPGSTAQVSGSGFNAGETVELQVLHADGKP